ncbi:hypothetical protein [Brevibacterium atlanticum]|uniref:hypothetical protein n=1 Tax=Brevibacterium atlanticum TaxID=2697563 RepID=UPI001421EC91|nr:hypothetical protein [Brevibacterium atlanticum]
MTIIERAQELARLEASGWFRLSDALNALDVPADFGGRALSYLRSQSHAWWRSAEERGQELAAWMAGHRFAEQAELGLLIVPSPSVLDVRGRLPQSLRSAQRNDLLDDVVDDRLGAGVDSVAVGTSASVFLTCVGIYGISLGSFDDIIARDPAECTVTDTDIRTTMTRQLWGARVLQAGTAALPDTELNDSWTFTLFVGDGLSAGMVGSGTILKSHVRFRLGKSNRGIGSARVAPALHLGDID